MSEIKANELRIGNKVIINDDGDHYAEVITIFRDVIDCKYTDYDGHKCSMTGPLQSITPIPLTEEILLKCGFGKFTNILEYDYRLPNGFSIAYDVDDEEYFLFHLSVLYPKHCFKYLHQLQNLYFALTGEELQINLKNL